MSPAGEETREVLANTVPCPAGQSQTHAGCYHGCAMNDLMGLGRLATRVGRSALDLLFPPKCAGCGREGAYLCDVCIAESPKAPDATGQGLEAVISPFQMVGAAREVVHKLKYSGLRVMAEPMGVAMAQHAERHRIAPDIIVPVPLHRKRLRERGYNQATLLAHEVGKWMGVPVDAKGLVRTEYLGPQARAATREERQANVAGAFASSNDFTGLNVMVVDDVTTTGSTLEACAAAISGSGASLVWGLTFAREI
jgi:competence protein ComFC